MHNYALSFCLVLGLSAATAPTGLAADPSAAAALLTGEPLRRALAEPVGISWSGRTFGEAIDSLVRTQRLSIVVDRRIDPSRTFDWSSDGTPLERLLETFAAKHDCGVVWIGPTAYITPKATAAALPQTLADRNAEANALAADLRTALASRRSLAWNDLTEPRVVLESLAAEAKLRWTNLDVVPHDLLRGIATPPLSLVERLTLAAAEFGMTYSVDPTKRTITLRAPPATVKGTPTAKPPHPVVPANASPGVQVYTLKVQDVPLSKLVAVLRDKHGLKIRFDDEAIRRAGLSIDKMTAVDVTQATLESLLDQAAAPLGLTAKREGAEVVIRPQP